MAAAMCRSTSRASPGYVDPATLQRMEARGEDPLKSLKSAIDADNAVIAGLQGRRRSACTSVAAIAPACGTARAITTPSPKPCSANSHYDRLLLEYDSERAGSFDPLRFVRKGTIVVLGLVTTKSGEIETVDELRRRIDAAAKFCPLWDQLALSPQCGFASGIGGNALDTGRAMAQARRDDGDGAQGMGPVRPAKT